MSAGTGIVTVYAVFADRQEAERISRIIVEERLAACANILGQTESIYWWGGHIATSAECAVLFKTTQLSAVALFTRVVELHSYENPAITVWPITHAPLPYVKWVKDECR